MYVSKQSARTHEHWRKLTYEDWTLLIGERSEPLSDKLSGEICIAMRALVCIYLYIYAYGLKSAPCPRYMLLAQRGQLICAEHQALYPRKLCAG